MRNVSIFNLSCVPDDILETTTEAFLILKRHSKNPSAALSHGHRRPLSA